MKDLQALLKELFDDLLELGDDEFIEKSRNLLSGRDKSSVLIVIFLEFQNSNSGALLTNLAFWFEKIEYGDVVKAMLALGKTDLPAYHFALYIPEILGVDVIKAALEIQEEYPAEKEKLSFFANLTQLIGPSKHTIEVLRDSGAMIEEIRKSLLKTGAPLLPLPSEAKFRK